MAKGLTNEKLAIHIAYVVLLVWAVSFVLDIFVDSFQPPTGLHAIMMAVVTGIFGKEVFKKPSQDKENQDSEP